MADKPKKYRVRRGKLVEVPPEWAGKVTSAQTRKKRKKEGRDQGDMRRQQATARGVDAARRPHWGRRHKMRAHAHDPKPTLEEE